MRNKLSFFSKKASNYSLLSIILGAIIGFFVYYLTKQLLLPIIIPFLSYSIIMILLPLLQQNQSNIHRPTIQYWK